MSEQTIKCQICGDPYVAYMHYAGDQSACPRCRAKARDGGSGEYIIVTSNSTKQLIKRG